ncbi:MAG TPA: glycosyltransferase [Gaiellaceae bacterium]
MRVLTVTNMWPQPGAPQFGIFVERQVAALRHAGVDVDVQFVNGRASTVNYPRALPEYRARLRRGRYDLVHATYVLSGVIARAQRRVPVVLTHTGIEVLESWQAPVAWALSRVVDEVIVRNEGMRQRLGLPDATVLPAGVDFDVFRPVPQAEARAALGLVQDDRIVLFVGEPRPEKRLDVIAAAVELLRADDSRIRLEQVCGRPQEEVAAYMSAADVLALASDNEGSPGAVKEAMACNLPVVSVDVGDVAAVIGRTEGCFLAAREPAAFARGLAAALDFGARTDGRSAVAHLSWPAVTARLIEVYERALAR